MRQKRKSQRAFVQCILLLSPLLFFGSIACNTNSQSNKRLIRAADTPLSTAVKRMQQVARVTSGIALQTALIDGQQPPDELIAELLHFGGVTPTQISSIDKARLQNTMKSLRELPGKMVDAAEVKVVEGTLAKLEELRKLVQDAGGGSKWEGKDEFLAEMNSIKENGVNLTRVASMESALDNLKHQLKNTVKSNLKPEKYKDQIENAKEATADLLIGIEAWNQATDKLPKYSTIESAEISLAPLSKLIGVVAKALEMSNDISSAPDGKGFTANMKDLSSLSASLNIVLPDLEVIRNVLEARTSPHTLKYPGLPNGIHDIDALHNDSDNQWIRQVTDWERMTAALMPLKELTVDFAKTTKAFEPFDNKGLEVVTEMLRQAEQTRTVSPGSHTTMDALWKCKQLFSTLQSVDSTKVNEFINSAKEMDKSLAEMKTPIDSFVEVWNTKTVVDLMNEVDRMLVFGDNDVLNKKTIGTLKASVSVTELEKILKDADDKFSEIQSSSNKAKTRAENIITDSAVVQSYIDSLSNFQPLFKILNDIKQKEVDHLTEAIDIFRKIATAKGTGKVVQDGEKTVNGVLAAADSFTTLRQTITKVKGAGTPESDALKALPDAEKQSNIIGSATRRVSAMKVVLDRRAAADTVIQHAAVVETHLASATMDPKDVNTLKEVGKVAGALKEMLGELDTWKGQTIDESSTKLESYSDLLSSAQKVTGVKGNLLMMSTLVGKLASNVTGQQDQNQLRGVSKALKTLGSIGLDFDTYATSFTNYKESLVALNQFLANFRVETSSVPPAAAAAIYNPNPNQNVETTAASSYFGLIFGIGCFILLIVLVGLMYLAAHRGWFGPFCKKVQTSFWEKLKKLYHKLFGKPKKDKKDDKKKKGKKKDKNDDKKKKDKKEPPPGPTDPKGTPPVPPAGTGTASSASTESGINPGSSPGLSPAGTGTASSASTESGINPGSSPGLSPAGNVTASSASTESGINPGSSPGISPTGTGTAASASTESGINPGSSPGLSPANVAPPDNRAGGAAPAIVAPPDNRAGGAAPAIAAGPVNGAGGAAPAIAAGPVNGAGGAHPAIAAGPVNGAGGAAPVIGPPPGNGGGGAEPAIAAAPVNVAAPEAPNNVNQNNDDEEVVLNIPRDSDREPETDLTSYPEASYRKLKKE